MKVNLLAWFNKICKVLPLLLFLSSHSNNVSAETIRPYILSLNPTSATVCWVTNQEMRGKLSLYSVGSQIEFTESSTSTFHKVDMRNLISGTRYRYVVEDVYHAEFTTASTNDPFEIVVFGHTGGTEAEDQYPVELLAQKICDINPDFALCAGDITYYATLRGFTKNYFHRFGNFLASKPIYIAPGNHDCGWPMLYGIDYSTFRKLFPYNYASENGAYYSFVYKNTKFIALSYVMPKREDFQKQIKWLLNELDSSDSEFNIVFLGGAQEGYYDKKLLFKSMVGHRVDLVFGGDGANLAQNNIDGINFFFAGTSFSRPHQFYYLQFEKYRFRVRLFDSTGIRKRGFWAFYSAKEKKVVQSLQAPIFLPGGGSPKLAVHFKPIAISSEEFDGIGLIVEWNSNSDARLRVRWAPVSEKKLLGERYFREQVLSVKANKTNKYLVPLPSVDPLSQKPYNLDEIYLRIEPRKGHKVSPEQAHVEAYLFKDK